MSENYDAIPLEKLLAEIEERAKAATPGKWDVCRQEPGGAGPTYVIRQGGAVYYDEICTLYVSPDGKTGNPDHVARMDPATTLKLVAIIRRQAEALKYNGFTEDVQAVTRQYWQKVPVENLPSVLAGVAQRSRDALADVAKIAEGVAG